MNKRIFIEKKSNYTTEALEIKNNIKKDLDIDTNVRYLKVYDIFDTNENEVEYLTKNIIATENRDIVLNELDLNLNIIATQLLPGSFDNRAVSALDCLLLKFDTKARIYCGECFIIDDNVDTDLIKKYLINKVEKQEFDLTTLKENNQYLLKTDFIHIGFNDFDDDNLSKFLQKFDLTMNLDDIKAVQSYFKNNEKREPTNLEINMLETYWSDHCRHTTFETSLNNINILDSKIRETFDSYLNMHCKICNNKPITLMDLASIYGKYVVKNGLINDIEVSDEVNACSVFVDVDVDGIIEKWLMMFKNETHNHPTEIEPFGGAATCIGGAIRDPLSGRSYVYQAMRISGSKNPLQPTKDTLEHKLTQAKISKISAKGNSSYGNQIGLTTSYVKEIFDDGYVAKHMELGAVVGATKASDVSRLKPKEGDVVILVGGMTGKDGIGGASGSSKVHTEDTLTSKMAEVQKGNPIEERKLQRLFRNSQVSKMIKKSNDFGAGGVSVAIGEIADSILIDLSKIPLKYEGLSSYEIALSESQERMAVLVDKSDADEFISYAQKENLQATVVAYVTDNNRLEMKFEGNIVVSLDREFLDTNGVRREQDVIINKNKLKTKYFAKSPVESFSSLNGASQYGLQRMFDFTIGSNTVLAPYGGKYKKTAEDVSVVKFPVEGHTTTASALAYGYNPIISKESPYLGAIYANISAISKLIACGCDFENIKFTYQEYFPKLGTDPNKWGRPLASLLGAFKVQSELNLPAIGGKDSMSGTFKDIEVPDTLVAFAINTIKANDVISSELKSTNSKLYCTNIKMDDDEFDYKDLIKTYKTINKLVKENKIISMKAIDVYGISHTICQMSFGNKIGVAIDANLDLYKQFIGNIIIETNSELESFEFIGTTTSSDNIKLNDLTYDINELINISDSIFEPLYQTKTKSDISEIVLNNSQDGKTYSFPTPKKEARVLIPVFPGTNCEYDMQRAFKDAGGNTKILVINNLNNSLLKESLKEFANEIYNSDIIAFPGGFSLGDEPDGSGKFIANVLKEEHVSSAIATHLDNKKLIIGICNGFQGLIESGLLPFGKIAPLEESSPILFRNDINEHVSDIVDVKITSNNSPWLKNYELNKVYKLPISHGEGKFVCNQNVLNTLIKNNQIFSQYVNSRGEITNDPNYNLNGSINAIEGILSPCGLILGKMGHNERYTNNTLINTYGEYDLQLFKNAINYIKGE